MAWRREGARPLSKPMATQSLKHIWGTGGDELTLEPEKEINCALQMNIQRHGLMAFGFKATGSKYPINNLI